MNRYEQAPNIERPTQAQLRRLAAIGIGSAAYRDRLKHTDRTGPAYYAIDELDLMTGIEMSDDPTQVRHRMAMRVGTRREESGVKVGSLKFFDSYWTERQPGEWIGERTLYRFEWDRRAVHLAERTFRLVGVSTPERSLESYLDGVVVTDDMPDILHAESQVSVVTQADCEDIIDSAREYFDTVDMLHQRID